MLENEVEGLRRLCFGGRGQGPSEGNDRLGCVYFPTIGASQMNESMTPK